MKNFGLALMIGGVGYTAWRANMASKNGVPLDRWFKETYATSGALPAGVAVAVGAFLYFR